MKDGIGKITEKKCRDLAGEIMEKALKSGAQDAETYITSSQELSIDVRNQEVETMKIADAMGVGLRVIKDGRMGFSFTSHLNPESMDTLVEQAKANSINTVKDEHNHLPDPPDGYPEVNVFDHQVGEIPLEDKILLAKEIEKKGRAHDKRIKTTESCSYNDAHYMVAISSSRGVSAFYKGTLVGAYAHLVAEEDGDSQTGLGFHYSTKYRDINPGEIGVEGAEKAVTMLGARGIDTQKTNIVLDPYIATSFLGVLAPALSAEAVQKDKSLLKDRIGEKLLSNLLTLVDDGSLEGGIHTSPFDGEGVDSQRTPLFVEGVLKGYLYNSYTALVDGRNSTGNGIRYGSFMGTPDVGTTNLYIPAGETPREELISRTKEGLYITEVLGMHTANPISGDFSVGAAGLWIENGELTYPVRGVAIAGNLLDLLSNVDAVGDDLRFFGGKGAPTIRIPHITVSGG